MSERDSPRVLVLAQNKIQPFTGGGVLLSGLFHEFPAENLLFLHRDREYGLATPFEEHRLVWTWLRLDLRAFIAHAWNWLRDAVKEPRKIRAGDLVALVLASSYFRLPRSIDERIRKLRPEIIYAWAADSLWSRTLQQTARRYRLPYVIHFMDNHFEVEPSTPLERSLMKGFRQQLSLVASRAAALYTISDSMGRAYQGYWNRPYEVFHAVIDPKGWPWPNPRSNPGDGVFRLAFAGSTDSSQLEGLAAVAAELDGLIDGGRKVRLVLYLTKEYASAAGSALRSFRCVEIRPHPESAALRSELASVDALVLAYSFSEASVRYYRYSFATKIAAYMLSGRPILAYGPKAIEPIDYVARGGWALVVGEPDANALTAAIEKLMSDAGLRETLAKTAWETGVHEHDRDRHADRFADSLLRLRKHGR
jgi:glycosyltransferase involved in cell wall biosynthesis